jgi:hypothetical protein
LAGAAVDGGVVLEPLALLEVVGVLGVPLVQCGSDTLLFDAGIAVGTL